MSQPEQLIPYQYVFTVFTPTYNRAHTLHRVYKSLKAQTYRNFEWLIVDDGSTDNTYKLVEKWQEENLFPIRYLYQKNSGKHIAFNRGVREAKGELFLNLDSDDGCIPQALERFLYHWDTILEERKNNFSAVTCLCQDQQGKIVGSRFPFESTDSNLLEIRYKFKVSGEKWGFHRTDILLKFPFPEISGQKFISENVVWNAISRQYKARFINEPLRIYFGGSDQLTKSGSPKENALGHALWHKTVLNTELDYIRFSPISFLRSSVHYIRFSFHNSTSVSKQIKSVKPKLSKFLLLVSLPFGFLIYWLDNLRLKTSKNPQAVTR